MVKAFKIRDYRLLWTGQTVSFLGDQFHLVALPWLVLQITGDPLQLGLVLATVGVPRAIFMLVGGALADRFSPRTLMLVSDAVRLVATGLLAAVTLAGTVELWMVYVLAGVMGVMSGIFVPAANASIPRLVPDAALESGNALMRMAEQGAQFLGPAAAGILIALFGREVSGATEVASLTGVGVAQAVDALTFGISAACLALIRTLPAVADDEEPAHPLQSVLDGGRFVWGNGDFRWLFVLIALANFCVAGPLLVGVPVLADTRLAEGAAAFGLIMSAYAGGNLLGMVGAGTLPRLRRGAMGTATVSLFALFGVALGSLALIESTWQAVPVMVVTGIGNGYLAITLLSHLQRITPERMLGRVMGILMFAMYGLMPLSQALSGWVVRSELDALFIGAGACLLATAALAAARPEVRALGEQPAEAPSAL